MQRFVAGVAAMLWSGCLIANPEYLGQGATETGSADGSASAPASSSSAASTTGVDSASGDDAGGATEPSGTGSSAASSSGSASSASSQGTSSSTTGDTDELCPEGAALRVCLNFDVEDPLEVLDQSSYGYPVAAMGGAIADGPWLGAFEFSERTRVEVDCAGECAGGSAVTYEAWVRLDGLPAAGDRAGVVDNNGILGVFVTPEPALRCVSVNGTAEGGLLPQAEWTHVACVADGEMLRAYVGGVSVAEVSITPLLPTADPLPLGVGNNAPQFNDALLGALDRVRVWDEARTAEQLLAAATP